MSLKLARYKSGAVSYLEGGQGFPILCLHGFPGSSHTWERFATTLLDIDPKKFRLLIPDLLGFGESETPSDNSIFMNDQAAAIAGLLQRLGISDFYFVGHDFGGPVAMILLRSQDGFNIRKMVLSATNLFTDTPIPLPLQSAGIPLLGEIIFRLMAGSVFGFRMMHQFAAANKREATWESFQHHITPHGLKSTAKIFQTSLANLEKNYRPIQDMASRINVPTLILWGDRDPFFPISVAQRSNKLIPNSILKVYKGTGHFVPEERPQELAVDISEFFKN